MSPQLSADYGVGVEVWGAGYTPLDRVAARAILPLAAVRVRMVAVALHRLTVVDLLAK